eukprot:7391919-Prymnesium_polylepis.2
MFATFSSTTYSTCGASRTSRNTSRSRLDFSPPMPRLALFAIEKSQHGLPAATTRVEGGRLESVRTSSWIGTPGKRSRSTRCASA